MRKNISRVLEAFKLGKPKSEPHLMTDGRTVFSYEMPIAARLPDGRIAVVDRGFSPSATTSAHIRPFEDAHPDRVKCSGIRLSGNAVELRGVGEDGALVIGKGAKWGAP